MTAIKRKEVRGEVVQLDYADLRDTNYINCKLVYKGGSPPILVNCTFDTCEFVFENEALNTIRFIAGIANSSGGQELVLHKFLGLPQDEANG